MSFTYPVEETQAARIAELEAENARLRKVVDAAVEWADAFPGYEAGASGSSEYMRAREGLLRATVREYRKEMAQTRQSDEYLPSTLKRVSLIEEHFRGKKPDGE